MNHAAPASNPGAAIAPPIDVDIPSELDRLEEEITGHIVAYSHASLRQSAFFSALALGFAPCRDSRTCSSSTGSGGTSSTPGSASAS